ncbi:hypothetical protein Fcan01_01081 [Folsomia candida]|uniref:Endonuclease/exonuclease/phosphatase domain-containing protein n=1 Tax=Folsomia candida TaxID=158441 RepID=A0A226F4Q7_FOLCA|nr:hypothetical protein Fcan01_01081 [Folsomia candida]
MDISETKISGKPSSKLSELINKLKMKRNGFYKIIFVNLQQLKECNIEELQETQRVAGCNVICLSETWHRPHNWPGGQQEERQHLAKLHNALNANTEGRNWFIHDIPCTCIGKINYDAIFGRHGMVIFCHPDLICEQRDVVMPTLNMQIDHRQAAVVLKTKDNKHECHLISCHLRTGDGTGDLDGGLKRLQLRATIDHLLKAPSDAILVAGGDFNIHPTKPFMGELIFQRYKDAVEKEKEAEEERKSEMCNQGVPLKDMSKDEFNSYKRLTQKRYEDNLKANDYQKYVARKNNNVNSSRIAKKRTWDRKNDVQSDAEEESDDEEESDAEEESDDEEEPEVRESTRERRERLATDPNYDHHNDPDNVWGMYSSDSDNVERDETIYAFGHQSQGWKGGCYPSSNKGLHIPSRPP